MLQTNQCKLFQVLRVSQSQNISRELRHHKWSQELANLDANQSFEHVATIIRDLSGRYIPSRPPGDKKPPWRTRPPTSLIRQRQQAWSLFKEVRQRIGRRSPEATIAFNSFANVNRSYYHFELREQAKYEEGLLSRLKDNPKLIHSYIRSKKVGQPAVGPLKLCSGSMTDNPSQMAECFASSFASVYISKEPANPEPHQLCQGHLDTVIISPNLVHSVLQNLDPNSSMGPDNIHPSILKHCSRELAEPMSVIFSRSLGEGSLPRAWKSSLVKPIFKKGPRYNALNYRPISLTSVCSKVMERILAAGLTEYLTTNSLLSEHQFGFRTGRSTTDQLLLVYNEVSRSTDIGGTNDVIMFDYSKAFDVVSHKIMCQKLENLGIGGTLLQWIKSFLIGREMCVDVRGVRSTAKVVKSGVPQGSVLGPILFLVYINSIASRLVSSYKIFADDLKLFACVSYHSSDVIPPSSPESVQRDIDILHKTSLSWGLRMNRDKCAVLRFSRPFPDIVLPRYCLADQEITTTQSHVDLGVRVDTDLKFHSHIRETANKAGGIAQNLLKSTVCRSPDFMIFLWKTHIRPVLEYGSCIWNTGFIKDLRLMEGIQRRWTKQITGHSEMSYGDRLQALNLYSLKGRLHRADLIQCWKILNGQSCIQPEDLFEAAPQPTMIRRGHGRKIFVPTFHTGARQRFFYIRCISVWNALPADIANAPDLKIFKRMLDSCLSHELYDFV